MLGDLHVLPYKDIQEHTTNEWCPCKPELIKGVYVHNSFDGREKIEVQLKEIGLSGGSWYAFDTINGVVDK